jgi:hypothetical protein
MNRAIPSLLLVAAASFATVPVAFTSGTPAKADDINKNFASLDSSIQKKADATLVSVLQTAVAGKADQAKLDELAKSVATKASLTDLGAKKDSAWIVATINGKLPAGNLSVANNLKDVADPAAARTNLGLGALATRESLTASDVGALTQTTADSRYLSNTGDTLSGNYILRGNAVFRDTTAKRSWLFGYSSNYIGIGSSASGNGLPVIIWTGTTDTAAVFAADHVSLGRNTTISGTLKVTGKITAPTSGSSVPDYVFEPDYKLAPLSEVEAFTKANKHLPEVPSAADIEKNGLDLAKMNLLLLKKVEELTLHTIELEKRLKAVEVATKP